MAAAIDFIGQVFDTLAKTLNITQTPNQVMQMAWPGITISPADFKPAANPTGPYSADVAREQFSMLADMAPALDKLRYINSGYEISDLYEALISSAIPAGATHDTVTANPLYQMFSNAIYDFITMKRGTMDDPNVFYHASTATPANWYDESAAQFWPEISISSTASQSASTPSIFTTLGGKAALAGTLFRLKPKAALPITMPATTISQGLPGVKPLNNTLLKAATASGMKSATMSTLVSSNLMQKDVFVANLNAGRKEALFSKTAVPFKATKTAASKAGALTNIKVMPDFTFQGTKRLTLDERLLVGNIAFDKLPARQESSTSSGFSIRFKYCRVNIERPWLNLTLLSLKNWYISGSGAGEYSTGSLDNNPGMFPLLPTSFIVVKDLSITANWSASDKTTIQDAVSFGPFDVRNGSWNSNTLTIPGMQIICWISRLMPMLAPAAGNIPAP